MGLTSTLADFGAGSLCRDDVGAPDSPGSSNSDNLTAPSSHPASLSLFELPPNVWAIIAPRLSARAIEALRLSSRAGTQLVDSQLLLALSMNPTVPWLLSLQRAGCTRLLAGRFPSLERLSLRPASAKDYVRRIDLAACLAALGPCPSLRALRLTGWPVPYQTQLYGTLPYWAPSLTALALDGVVAGALDGAAVAALSAGLPSLRRLAVRFGSAAAAYEHRLPLACPNLGPLTQLTGLLLAGVMPNQAAVSSLAPLTRLEDLHLDLLHDGYDKGMQVLDLRHHTRLTNLVLRARPTWQQASSFNPRHPHHQPHHRHARAAAVSPLPCPAALRLSLQHLPPSLESLAVELPPWRPRADASWAAAADAAAALSPTAATAASAGAQRDDVAPPLPPPALRLLACPPDLVPCLRELGLNPHRLRCLRLCAVDPLGNVGVGGVGRGAAPPCWTYCCGGGRRPFEGGREGGGGGNGTRVATAASPSSAVDGGRSHRYLRSGEGPAELREEVAALAAASGARALYGGADVIAALECLPGHLLQGRRRRGRDASDAAGAGAAAATPEFVVTTATIGGCVEGGANTEEQEEEEALRHLEINVRLGRAQEPALLRLLGQLSAAARSHPAPGPPPASATAAATVPFLNAAIPAAAAPAATAPGRAGPVMVAGASTAATAAAAVSGDAASGFQAAAVAAEAAAASLDLQLSLERDLPPAALVASMASAAGGSLRHLALLDLHLSYSASRYDSVQQSSYGARDGAGAAAAAVASVMGPGAGGGGPDFEQRVIAAVGGRGEAELSDGDGDRWPPGTGAVASTATGTHAQADVRPSAGAGWGAGVNDNACVDAGCDTDAEPRLNGLSAGDLAVFAITCRGGISSSSGGTARAVGPGPAAALLAALGSLRHLCSLTLQPVRNLLGALRVLAGHPALRVLRLLDVEEDGARAADRPLLPRLRALLVALGDPRVGSGWAWAPETRDAEPAAGAGAGGSLPAARVFGECGLWEVGPAAGIAGAGRVAAGRLAEGGEASARVRPPGLILVVVPQLLAWEVEWVNREAEAATGGACACELVGGG